MDLSIPNYLKQSKEEQESNFKKMFIYIYIYIYMFFKFEIGNLSTLMFWNLGFLEPWNLKL